MSINDILTITLTLFAVVDILGALPLIISIRQKKGHINSFKATVVSFFIMMAFLFLGENLLHLIGIDVHSFSMAGAIVIFLLALEMILNIELFKSTIPFFYVNFCSAHDGRNICKYITASKKILKEKISLRRKK